MSKLAHSNQETMNQIELNRIGASLVFQSMRPQCESLVKARELPSGYKMRQCSYYGVAKLANEKYVCKRHLIDALKDPTK